LLARRRPGLEPGLHKHEHARLHGPHYTRVSDYDVFAADYDVRAAGMTGDVAWYRPGGRFAWNSYAFSPLIAARLHGVREERKGDRRQVMRHIAADSVAGLYVEALPGGFRREPFDDDSLELVWVARKPG
jgi:hypothetical protein